MRNSGTGLGHSLSLGQQWLGMSSVHSERGFSSDYTKALCGDGWKE
jgi:hypothetical protein